MNFIINTNRKFNYINSYNLNYHNLFLNLNQKLIFLKNTDNFIFFFNSKEKYSFYLNLTTNLISYFNIFTKYFYYYYYFFFSFIIGLGYKRRINLINSLLYLYLGDRHWVIIPIPKNILVLPIKKRSFILFSNNRIILRRFLNIIKNLKKENFYKIKGIFFIRSFRRWLNVRYVKIKFLKTKLSKKQQLI